MKKRLFSAVLTLLMVASLCVGAVAFDPMSPPEPGAADGFVETKAEWNSDNLLAGHHTTETTYTYDKDGRILTRTEVFTSKDDPEMNSTDKYLYSYDAEGRLSRTVREDGNHEFVYSYNEDGSHFLTYTWWSDDETKDQARTNVRTYDPCAKWYWFGEWTFTFDDKGNMTGRTSKNGEKIVYENTFDDAGRLSKVTMTSQKDQTQETQTYAYNADGSYVLTWASKTGAEIFTYNAKGELVKYGNTYWEDPDSWTYEYDEHGNNILRTHGDKTSMKYTYEAIPTPTPAPTASPEPTASPKPTESPEPTASPKPTASPEPEIPFKDVKKTDYFAAPVAWAVNHDPQITQGKSADTFAPADNCTRAQIATFLWRAKGCQEPTSTNNPFSDVKNSDYFYKAVLWAVEKGITQGTDKTHFSPNAGCTRAQAVTFLWRADGKPDAKVQTSKFADVKNVNDYFYTPVLWAVEQGITQGTDAAHFTPSGTCTRAQIVTFLYRDMAK